MSVERDIVSVPASPAYEPALALPLDRDPAPPATLHQEINARRARIENPELLRRLRGL